MDSLVAPRDKPKERPALRSSLTPLTDEEMERALPVKSRDLGFTQVDRKYADPPLMNQKITLVSFTPSKGARPDEDNIYGMMKVRGVFATEEEANERAEFLIRNVDSYHEIYHAFVGRPFPVTTSDGFEKELQTIDIRKKTVKLISEDILSKKSKEEKEMKEIQDREKNLLESSRKAKEEEPEDPFELYIMDQVKRAQLLWTYRETKKKVDQMKDLILSLNSTIALTESEHEDYAHRYKEKYMAARKDANLPENHDDDSFLKYLGVDGMDEVLSSSS